mmetsp:Transcript_12530/g.40070  ORF Transcript_12530/g.40070 Transcript_12530/m.40070 type:complete len:233 (+) Transcript_12530:100-798(+)
MSFQSTAAVCATSVGFSLGCCDLYSCANWKKADWGFFGFPGGRSHASFFPESLYAVNSVSYTVLSLVYASSYGRFPSGFMSFHATAAVFITADPGSSGWLDRKCCRNRSQGVMGLLGLSGSLLTAFSPRICTPHADEPRQPPPRACGRRPPSPTAPPAAAVRCRARTPCRRPAKRPAAAGTSAAAERCPRSNTAASLPLPGSAARGMALQRLRATWRRAAIRSLPRGPRAQR